MGGLYPARGSGVLIFDQGLRRILPVSAEGQLQDVVALPIPGSSSSQSNRGPDRYVPDSLGNAYGALRFETMTEATFPFVRYKSDGRADTVAQLLKPQSQVLEATANTVRSRAVVLPPLPGRSALGARGKGIRRGSLACYQHST